VCLRSIFLARKALSGFYEDLNRLRRSLTGGIEHLTLVQLQPMVAPAPVPALVHEPIESSTDGEGVETVAISPAPKRQRVLSPVAKTAQTRQKRADDLKLKLGEELFGWFMDSDIHVCSHCHLPQKIGKVYQNGHTSKGCPQGAITAEDKKWSKGIKKKIASLKEHNNQ
jgi:hypothetical protein